jgi:hypothetical protein
MHEKGLELRGKGRERPGRLKQGGKGKTGRVYIIYIYTVYGTSELQNFRAGFLKGLIDAMKSNLWVKLDLRIRGLEPKPDTLKADKEGT